MPTMRFEGELPEGVFIKRETNPWLQAADEDEPFNLQDARQEIGQLANDGHCYDCWDCMVQGVIEAMDTPFGIQRCDNCGQYEGDLEAAAALADALTDFYVGAVRFHVWVETEEAEA